MCASCGCGCKPGKTAKGCNCTCKTCRDARTMSVEKSHLIRKSNRGFEAIADALLEDVYEDDFEDNLVVDEEGNVYALVGEIEKSEKSRRYASNAAIGAGTGATAAGAGLAGMGYKVFRDADKIPEGPGQANKKLVQAISGLLAADKGLKLAGLGGGYAAAGLGLRAYNKKKSSVEKGLSPKQMKIARQAGNPKKIDAADLATLRNRSGVAKGLPSVARQAMREGKQPFKSDAMQFRMGMNQAGRNAARNLSATGGSPFASTSIAAGQSGKQTYRNLSGQNQAVDPGRLGGEQGKRRLAELTARRQARQAALASRSRQNAQATGRGVLP